DEVTLADREPDGTGSTLVVRARRSPILGVWLVLEDVAELRRLQRIRAEFIDNLSHELRTPITTVGLLVESLTRDAEGAAEAGAGVRKPRAQRGQVQPVRHGGAGRRGARPGRVADRVPASLGRGDDARGLGVGRRAGGGRGGSAADLRALLQGGSDAKRRRRDRP